MGPGKSALRLGSVVFATLLMQAGATQEPARNDLPATDMAAGERAQRAVAGDVPPGFANAASRRIPRQLPPKRPETRSARPATPSRPSTFPTRCTALACASRTGGCRHTRVRDLPRRRFEARAGADAKGPHHRLHEGVWNPGRGADRRLSLVSLRRTAQPLARFGAPAIRRLLQRLPQPDERGFRRRADGAAVDQRNLRDLPSRHPRPVQSPLAYAPARRTDELRRLPQPARSLTAPLLKTDTLNETCYQCHAEKRGPFLFEHAPVRDSCVNCHTPHGSNQQALLVAPMPFLCQQCHSHTRHPNDLLTAQSIGTGSNPDERLMGRGCISCHAQVHGSNHPSGPRFHR